MTAIRVNLHYSDTLRADRIVQRRYRTSAATDRLKGQPMVATSTQPGIDCLSVNQNTVEGCTDDIGDSVNAARNANEKRLAEKHGASYVGITPWFCADEACPAVINGLTVHRDSKHISENDAVRLSEVLGRATGMMDGPAAGATPSGFVPAERPTVHIRREEG